MSTYQCVGCGRTARARTAFHRAITTTDTYLVCDLACLLTWQQHRPAELALTPFIVLPN